MRGHITYPAARSAWLGCPLRGTESCSLIGWPAGGAGGRSSRPAPEARERAAATVRAFRRAGARAGFGWRSVRLLSRGSWSSCKVRLRALYGTLLSRALVYAVVFAGARLCSRILARLRPTDRTSNAVGMVSTYSLLLKVHYHLIVRHLQLWSIMFVIIPSTLVMFLGLSH